MSSHLYRCAALLDCQGSAAFVPRDNQDHSPLHSVSLFRVMFVPTVGVARYFFHTLSYHLDPF
jgi:hypothetical protein